MQVQKYILPFQPSVKLTLPVDAKVISVVPQDNTLWLYAMHDPEDPLLPVLSKTEVEREFRLIALGEEFSHQLTFITSVHCAGAVIHIFEAPR